MPVLSDGSIVTEIKITLHGSYRALIEIEGKQFEYGINLSEGCWQLNGLTEEERDRTIGGAVAQKIRGILPAILQNYMVEAFKRNSDSYEIWDKLPPKVAEKLNWDMESAL